MLNRLSFLGLASLYFFVSPAFAITSQIERKCENKTASPRLICPISLYAKMNAAGTSCTVEVDAGDSNVALYDDEKEEDTDHIFLKKIFAVWTIYSSDPAIMRSRYEFRPNDGIDILKNDPPADFRRPGHHQGKKDTFRWRARKDRTLREHDYVINVLGKVPGRPWVRCDPLDPIIAND